MKELTFEQLPKAVSLLNEKLDNLEKFILENSTKKFNSESNQLLTVKQAAEFLNLAVPTIYSKVSKNELPFMKRSKRLYFSRKELTEYIKKGRNKTTLEVEKEAEEYLSKKKMPRKY